MAVNIDKARQHEQAAAGDLDIGRPVIIRADMDDFPIAEGKVDIPRVGMARRRLVPDGSPGSIADHCGGHWLSFQNRRNGVCNPE